MKKLLNQNVFKIYMWEYLLYIKFKGNARSCIGWIFGNNVLIFIMKILSFAYGQTGSGKTYT